MRKVLLIGSLSALLLGCKDNKANEASGKVAAAPAAPAPSPVASTTPTAPSDAPPAQPPAEPPAATPTPAEPPAPAEAAAVCCCESSGDATHYTLEKDAASCGRPEMGGACVQISDCELPAMPRAVGVDQEVSINTDENEPLLAIWTAHSGQIVALEVKATGTEAATVRARAGEEWKKLGTVQIDAARGGTVTAVAHKDGSLTLTSTITGHGDEPEEVAAWTVRHDEPFGKVSFKRARR